MKPQPRACFRCHEVKPPSAFAWGDGKRGEGIYRRRRAVCRACEAKAAAEKAERSRDRRKTFTVDGRWMRRCRLCDEVKDLETGFYQARAVLTGQLSKDYQYDCRRCQSQRVGAYQSAMRKINPGYVEQRNEQTRRWRHENPETYREQRRRYRAGVHSDQQRLAADLEMRRIAYRLRRERKGADITQIRGTSTTLPKDLKRRLFLPVGPLVVVVKRYVMTCDESEDRAVDGVGISSRAWRNWKSGVSKSVLFDDADKVLTALGLLWFDVWKPGTEGFESVREAFEGKAAA